MRLLVGLGNPGPQYAQTRHNIGFMAVDRIAEDHGFALFRSKFNGLLSEGSLRGTKTLLLKPQTFMNLSGQSVAECAKFFKVSVNDIIVFHDELDLAPGKLKVKKGGGHAGHNGLRSIQSHLGPDFTRVRLGIGHPGHKDAVSPYVLGNFAKSDDWLDDLLRGIAEAAPDLAAGDFPRFQNTVALKTNPPRPSTGTAPAAKPEPAPAPAPDDRSPLQRLADRFR